MLSLGDTRRQVAVVVPVHFKPEVPQATIRSILVRVLADSEVFCRPENLLAVVDRKTPAEEVLRSLPGLRVHVLPCNRAKAGAVSAGLKQLLETTDAGVFITRDCDGDHTLEDIPRLAGRLLEIQEATGSRLAAAMGSRSSLEKPMGWLREEWEVLTNRILLDLVDYRLARDRRVMDRRFLGGAPPDIQSGYRAYTRQAAEAVVRCLDEVPEDPSILTFACEFVPFADLLLRGGVIGQVVRLTLVEQPVTSYGGVNLADTYGRLLDHLGRLLEIEPGILARFAENHVCNSSLLYSDHRGQVHHFMTILGSDPRCYRMAGFV